MGQKFITKWICCTPFDHNVIYHNMDLKIIINKNTRKFDVRGVIRKFSEKVLVNPIAFIDCLENS